MMPETVRAIAGGGTVFVARLFEFKFRSSTRRFWDGLSDLAAGGNIWEGSADVISVTGLEHAENLGASPATFQLSGTTPELIDAAVFSDAEVKNRPCAVYIQFLTSDAQPLDNPVALWSGRMDVLSFSGDLKNQSLTLSAETLFVDRIRSPYGYQTDRDQQARWPGDVGFEFMPSLKNKTISWLRQ